MPGASDSHYWLIEKDLFTFTIADKMLLPVLSRVPVLPIKAYARTKVIERGHEDKCICYLYTNTSKKRLGHFTLHSGFLSNAKFVMGL